MNTRPTDNTPQRSRVAATIAGMSAAVIIAGSGLAANVSQQAAPRIAAPVLLAASAAQGAGGKGIYTVQQAARGEPLYQQHCASCHQDDLTGRKVDGGPALRGREFTSRWGGLSIQALLTAMEKLMPSEHPLSLVATKSSTGGLDRQEYIDVVSFILKVNGVPAGKRELPTSPNALKTIVVHFKS